MTTIDRARVEMATAKLLERVAPVLDRSGVPGMAVGVVFDDEVVAAQGFGVRLLGRHEPVDADTVFQIASLSKSLGGSVMAALVDRGVIGWDEPVRADMPEFALADPWVSDHVTYADLFSHRSGLPDHAGDLLEDLGYDRSTVLDRLRRYPLAPFRASYFYTNFGLTAAAVAAAAKAGRPWEDLCRQLLYDPLGMAGTSSTYAEFMRRSNRAGGHVRVSGNWSVTSQPRQPDAQSPAGGVSTSISDLMCWLRAQLSGGTAGRARTWLPHALSSPPHSPTDRAGFYGLGLNVSYDGAGRLRLGHSGAFALGAGTALTYFPAERIGVAVLSNGRPTGMAEALIECFVDDLFPGRTQMDWFTLIGDYFERLMNPEPKEDFDHPPAGAAPPGAEAGYVGRYENDLYGGLEVGPAPDGGLQIVLSPAGQTYPLHPYDGDRMWWQFAGENSGPPAAATFAGGPTGQATSLTLDQFDAEGLGTFVRTETG